jgi:glycine cleavage system H lipoate-binding protein
VLECKKDKDVMQYENNKDIKQATTPVAGSLLRVEVAAAARFSVINNDNNNNNNNNNNNCSRQPRPR